LNHGSTKEKDGNSGGSVPLGRIDSQPGRM
jgi:hypothetical protein